jgi:WW domain-containing oxidoreductase
MTDFGFSSTAEEVTEGVSLAGKTVVITGCNSGLGKETTRVLAKRGAYIVGCARSAEKAQAALDELGVEGTAVACELSEPASVRAAVDAILATGRELDVIICNAGIMALPELKQSHGVEMQFMTNHVGHFIFVTGLLDKLSDDGRVVVVSSGAHWMTKSPTGISFDDLSGEQKYKAWSRYGESKLANVLFARELHKRFDGTKRVAVALHPGVIRTNLGRNNQKDVDAIFDDMDPEKVKTIPQGAATSCLLAAHPSGAEAGGLYYSDCQPKNPSDFAKDDALAAKLWEETEKLVANL